MRKTMELCGHEVGLQWSPDRYLVTVGEWILEHRQTISEEPMFCEGKLLQLIVVNSRGDNSWVDTGPGLHAGLTRVYQGFAAKKRIEQLIGCPITYLFGQGGQRGFEFGPEILENNSFEALPDDEQFHDGELLKFEFTDFDRAGFQELDGAAFKNHLRTWRQERDVDGVYVDVAWRLKERVQMALRTCGFDGMALQHYLPERGIAHRRRPYPTDGLAAKQEWVAKARAAIVEADQKMREWAVAEVAAMRLLRLSFSDGRHPRTGAQQLVAHGRGVKYIIDERIRPLVYAEPGSYYYCRPGRAIVDKPDFKIILVSAVLQAT